MMSVVVIAKQRKQGRGKGIASPPTKGDGKQMKKNNNTKQNVTYWIILELVYVKRSLPSEADTEVPPSTSTAHIKLPGRSPNRRQVPTQRRSAGSLSRQSQYKNLHNHFHTVSETHGGRRLTSIKMLREEESRRKRGEEGRFYSTASAAK